jgi:hypothetical protein
VGHGVDERQRGGAVTGAGATVDPALRFWLGWAHSEGALHEATPDTALVVLPRRMQEALALPEEISVTTDPEVAREDGALLLTAGHPALDHATEHVLDRGDAGHVVLARPAAVPPSPDLLLARARDAFPIDHGKIEPAGLPTVALLPVLRVGALLTQSVSLDDRFQERAEVWVDVATGLAVPDEARDRLAAAERADAGARPGRMPADLLADLLPGAVRPDGRPTPLAAAHRLLEEGAAARRAALARETGDSRAEELARTAAYFDAALDSIRKRRDAASAERRHLYDAREEATLAERARRLVEVEEKWQPRTEVRPFRLHVVWVPAQILPVHVRRGPRAYPLELRWLLPASAFLPPACPHCRREPAGAGSAASDVVLVAGKQRLGCRRCLDRPAPAAPAPSPPAPSAPARATRARPDPSGRDAAGGGEAPRGRQAPGAVPAGPPVPVPSARPAARRSTSAAPAAPAASAALDARRTAAAGEKLAIGLWQAAADGAARPLRRLLVPGSPLAALVATFGARAPAEVLGIGPREQLESVHSEPVEPRLTPPQACWGVLVTSRAERPFTLRWEMLDGRALATELIAVPGAVGHRLPRGLAFTLFGRPPTAAPAPSGALDAVAAALCAALRSGSELPLLGRCLAAWARACEEPRLSGHEPNVLAAAVHHQVARRSGTQLTYAVVAALYGADDAAVRAAAKTLQAVLVLSDTRCW